MKAMKSKVEEDQRRESKRKTLIWTHCSFIYRTAELQEQSLRKEAELQETLQHRRNYPKLGAHRYV